METGEVTVIAMCLFYVGIALYCRWLDLRDQKDDDSNEQQL